MVVDDESMIRQFVATVLEGSGYRVSDADSPARALQILESAPDLDLLVTDVVMPDGSGCDLADRMRERRPQLPVLFISGYEVDGVRLQSSDSFLQKPFRAPDLLERVRLMAG